MYNNPIVSLILECLNLDVPLVPYENPYVWARRRRKNNLQRRQYQQAVWNLKRQGYLKVVVKNSKKFISLTSEGQLEKLLRKANVVKTKFWDGKWRVLVFDIPEDSRSKRDMFRALLKRNNFVKLQASVFISAYPLNREAVDYLRKSGLMGFIRIMRVDAMDSDKDLKKKFNL